MVKLKLLQASPAAEASASSSLFVKRRRVLRQCPATDLPQRPQRHCLDVHVHIVSRADDVLDGCFDLEFAAGAHCGEARSPQVAAYELALNELSPGVICAMAHGDDGTAAHIAVAIDVSAFDHCRNTILAGEAMASTAHWRTARASPGPGMQEACSACTALWNGARRICSAAHPTRRTVPFLPARRGVPQVMGHCGGCVHTRAPGGRPLPPRDPAAPTCAHVSIRIKRAIRNMAEKSMAKVGCRDLQQDLRQFTSHGGAETGPKRPHSQQVVIHQT